MSVRELDPFNPVIQICPHCGKVDVYRDDGHECDRTFQERRNYDLYDTLN